MATIQVNPGSRLPLDSQSPIILVSDNNDDDDDTTIYKAP